jgi:hypothetical protein
MNRRVGRGIGRLCLGAGLLALSCNAVQASGTRHNTRAGLSGSIAFARGGNIFVARPDGSHLHQVTQGGKSKNGYNWPTQADNGNILALKNFTTLVHTDRNGRLVTGKIKIATGTKNPQFLHTLAFSPDLSPDDKRAAVSVLLYQGEYDPYTGARSANIQAQTVQYFNLAPAKKISERSLAGTYLESPWWVDNSRILMFGPYNIAAAEVYSDTPSLQGHDWFADTLDGDGLYDRKSLDRGEMDRSGKKLALIRGTNLASDWRGASIQVYTVSSLTVEPTPVCSLPAQHGALGKVTWSPDGSTLAWSDSNGIWESPVNTSAGNCGFAPKLVIRGGTNPDWGLAGVS